MPKPKILQPIFHKLAKWSAGIGIPTNLVGLKRIWMLFRNSATFFEKKIIFQKSPLLLFWYFWTKKRFRPKGSPFGCFGIVWSFLEKFLFQKRVLAWSFECFRWEKRQSFGLLVFLVRKKTKKAVSSPFRFIFGTMRFSRILLLLHFSEDLGKIVTAKPRVRDQLLKENN